MRLAWFAAAGIVTIATARGGGRRFTMRAANPGRDAGEKPGRDSSRVQSVDRAVMLLRAISASAQPLTAWELARACGINRSTAWRLLQTLEHHGLTERDEATQRYSIGYTALQMASS